MKALREIASAASCKWLVSFLEKIPNFRLKLTEEEKALIGEAGNVLAIGRSGTGKTTCALLRLFATEILFKVRSSFAKKGILKDTRFKAEDVDSTCGLHTVFVTASPVLTNEVRRYYDKLKEKIKQELVNKDKKKDKSELEVITLSEIEEVKEKPEETKSLTHVFGEIKEAEEVLEMIDEGEIEKQLNLAHSLNAVTDEQFPLFLTVRRLLLMIDGTLKRPFFARNTKGEIIGLDGNAEWHNENHGVMMINTMHKVTEGETAMSAKMETEDPGRLLDEWERDEEKDEEDEYDMEEEAESQSIMKEQNKDKLRKNLKTRYMAKEVDFEIFVKKFWPTIHGKVQIKTQTQTNRINAASVWREIQTHIKGSIEAHEYAAHHIPSYRYHKIVENSTVFNAEAQKKIYEIFYRYEMWCVNNNFFDMSDVVNHILSQIKWNGYQGLPIHFIMCDEVQDLPPATLFLLLKLAEQNLFFSGDTAQTIAKGISFRFSDLKDLFYNVQLPSGMPSIMQLTVNFRSHARILDLANSIIRALEAFFPSSIDRLKKEKSPHDGTIPVVLDSELQETLFNLLLGSQQTETKSSGGLLTKPPIEFGCDQVIIVRNQKAKQQLPRFLKHALCLTVYEAKGLEFDDVILYNFFTDSEAKEEWKLIKALIVEDVKVPIGFSNQSEFKQSFDQLTVRPWLLPESYKDLPEGKHEIIKNVITNARPGTLEGKYTSLMSELKHLYTVVTRPRKRLIIFDEDPMTRKPMLDYWLSLGYVNVITKEQLEGKTDTQSPTRQMLENLSGKNTSKVGWRAQGVRMFRRRYYEQAMKCFENSGDTELKLRAEGYFEATRASEVSAELEGIKYEIAEGGLTKEEKKAAAAKIEELTTVMVNSFHKAADLFNGLGFKTQAGQCYFSVQEYDKAADCFQESGLLGQAGEAYYKLGKYIEAGELYEKAKVPSNAILAYEAAKDWEKVMRCIHEFKEEFDYGHRLKLIKKYIQLALQAVLQEYEAAQEAVENAKNSDGKPRFTKELPLVEERLIEQLDSASDIVVSKPDEEEKKEDNLEKSEAGSAYNPFEKVNVSKVSESSNPFEEADLSTSSKPKQEQDQKSEFSILEVSSTSGKKAAIDIDHISGLDPDDEWIKCETGSIIDSVVSGKINPSNRESDYSMLDNAHAFAMNCSLVRTKRDIFIEDMTMSKVIRYASYFSDEVRTHLESLRSKSVLLHTKTDTTLKTPADFIIDLDDIDLPFVNLLLDMLESFGLYKLCIIICNRYQINDRIGRYIVSIGHRYSNIKLICKAYEKYGYSNTETYLEMQAKNSIIANAAMHGVLEMVNPAYLKMKGFAEMVDETNSLGGYCYRSMMLLGYWKKLVYIMDCQNSLALTSTFADYYNYKMIYLINFGHITKENVKEVQGIAKSCTFTWLPFTSPTNPLENQAIILALDSVIYDLNCIYKFTYLPKSGYFSAPIKKCPSFPPIFPCNYALWKYIFSPTEDTLSTLLSALSNASEIFLSIDSSKPNENLTEFLIWDFCTALMQVIFGSLHNATVQQFFLKFPSDSYNNLLQAIYRILSLLHLGKTNKVICDHYYTTYLAVLSAFGIRRVEGRDCRPGYGRFFAISRNSMYFTAAAQVAVKRQEQKPKDIEEEVARDMPAHLKKLGKAEFEKVMQNKLRDAMAAAYNSNFTPKKFKIGSTSTSDIYFSDLEAEYMFVPPELLTEAEQVNKITTARIEERDLEIRPKQKILEIWMLTSHEEIKEEVKRVTLKMGEIAFTLKLLKQFSSKMREILRETYKTTVLRYFARLLDLKEQRASKKKRKKVRHEYALKQLICIQCTLFFKLQYLSVILFSNGHRSHINAEQWILAAIQKTIRGLSEQRIEGVKDRLFPVLCCYLSIDKYILFVEQLRALCRSGYKYTGYLQTTWLDALAEYKTHCLDDSFGHLLQFFDENRKNLDIFTKLAVAEKIVTLGILLVGAINNKDGKEKPPVLVPTNLLKHFTFTKSKDYTYTYQIFKHNTYSETEEDDIRFYCRETIKQLLDISNYCFGPKKKKIIFDIIQTLILSLFLNAKDKKEILELIELAKLVSQRQSLRLHMVLLETTWEEWVKYQEQYRSFPDFLSSVEVHEAEWSFPFKIASVQLVHSEECKPNLEMLEKDGLKESHQMAIHLKIYKALRNKRANKEYLKTFKKPFAPEKYDLMREVKTFGYQLTPTLLEKFWSNKASGNLYQLSESVKDMHMTVLNTFYTTPIFNALDAHYIFTLLEQIDEYYVSCLKIIGTEVENKEELKRLPMNVKEIRDQLSKMNTELTIWKGNKFMPDEEYIEKKRIMYRTKWRQHQQRIYQQKVAKRTGQKRQEALMKKALVIKGKAKDIFGYI